MNKLVISLICVVAIIITIFGKVHYDNKLAAIGENAKEQQQLINSQQALYDHWLQLMTNMNEQLIDIFMQKLEADETITVLTIGSNFSFMSEEDETQSWPFQLKEELEAHYGNGKFAFEMTNVEDASTNHFIEANGHVQAASYLPDVLIVEPFLLNDNGIVKIDDTIENVELLIETVKEASPDVFVILQPPNPIFNPTVYVEQVDELQYFAKKHDYEYLNHWQVWPEIRDEHIEEFLDGVYPNANGQELWAEYIVNYFVAK
ncbi:hypothetical protein BTR23_03800 [Alkalihalophilus pseudofirmus]|nr:hypothetical protein BTR23_03800 [Alkalihalophilus pseudofirmus]